MEPRAEAAKPVAAQAVDTPVRATRGIKAQAAARQVRARGEPARAGALLVRRAPPARHQAGKAPSGLAWRVLTAQGAATSVAMARPVRATSQEVVLLTPVGKSSRARQARATPQRHKAKLPSQIAECQRRTKLLPRRACKPRPRLQQIPRLHDLAQPTGASPLKQTLASRISIQARSSIPAPSRGRLRDRSWHQGCPRRT